MCCERAARLHCCVPHILIFHMPYALDWDSADGGIVIFPLESLRKWENYFHHVPNTPAKRPHPTTDWLRVLEFWRLHTNMCVHFDVHVHHLIDFQALRMAGVSTSRFSWLSEVVVSEVGWSKSNHSSRASSWDWIIFHTSTVSWHAFPLHLSLVDMIDHRVHCWSEIVGWLASHCWLEARIYMNLHQRMVGNNSLL